MDEFLTFILGIVASVLGFWFVNIIFLPLKHLQEAKAKIGRVLQYYSHIVTNSSSSDLVREAGDAIRSLAVEIEEKYLLVPFRPILVVLHRIPRVEYVRYAKGSLLFISSSLSDGTSSNEMRQALDEIYTALNIPELEGRYNQGHKEAVEFRKKRLGIRYSPLKIGDKQFNRRGL